MCLIIHRPKGAPAISAGWLADFRRKNDNGFGAWWLEGGKIHIVKTLKAEDIEKTVRRVETLDAEAGFHWRQATHGVETVDNVHPFKVQISGPHKMVLAHNGILSDWAPTAGKSAAMTDTQMFIADCLEPLMQRFSNAALFRADSFETEVLEMLIGANRLLMAHTKYGFARVGTTWLQWRGLWLSNTYAWSHAQREKLDGPESPASTSFNYNSYYRGANAWQEATSPHPYRSTDGWIYEHGTWRPPPTKPAMPTFTPRLNKRARKRLAKAATMTKGEDGIYRFPGDPKPPAQLTLPNPATAVASSPTSLSGEDVAARTVSSPAPKEAPIPRSPVVLDSLRDTADILAGMSEAEITLWCQSEPYEAARLIREVSRAAAWTKV